MNINISVDELGAIIEALQWQMNDKKYGTDTDFLPLINKLEEYQKQELIKDAKEMH